MYRQDMEDKLSRFRAAVFREVEESIAKEDNEAAETLAAELEAFQASEQEIYEKKYREEIARLEKSAAQELSHAQLSASKAGLICRKEALDAIESAVTERILAYLNDQAYRETLIGSVAALSRKYPDGVSILLRKEDISLMKKAFPSMEVKEDKHNRLGGFTAFPARGGICVDATIAGRLQRAMQHAAKEL